MKPENVLISQQLELEDIQSSIQALQAQNIGIVKICDMGIAKLIKNT